MSAETSDGDDGRIRPFADVLRELGGGKDHDELSRKFRDLMTAVVAHGKKGDIVLKIAAEPVKGVEGGVRITTTLAVKAPQPERKASIFYTDRDGNAVRDDPNQLTFDGTLKAVEPTQPAAVREVPAPGAAREAR